MTDAATTLKQILDSSSQLSGWALAVLGATVATVVSTSYRRPDALPLRLAYLLFLPGWASVAYSLYLGNVLSGKYLASLMVRPEHVATIASQVNDTYADQRGSLLISLCFFGIWLVSYLLSWIFMASIQKAEKK